MTLLDIILAIPLCYFLYKGWTRGLIFETTSLAGIVGGCWAATHFSTWVAEALHLTGDWSVLLAFFITFIGVVVAAYFLSKVMEGFFKLVKAEFVNKVFGSFFGMIKCLCILGVLLNFVMLIDKNEIIITPKTQQESVLFKPAYKVGNSLIGSLRTYIQEHKNNTEEEHKA